MSAPIFEDRDEVLGLFGELDEQIGHIDGAVKLTIVGGIWMLLTGRRAGTRDIDTITRLPEEAQTAVDLIAERHGLSRSWLNADAAAWWPAWLRADDCAPAWTGSNLTVVLPPADAVFVMKLNRASPLDQEDLRSIWPDCTFENAAAAVQAFEAAYPNEEPSA